MTATLERLRPELDAPLPQMRNLKIARGYLVPWFVGWINGEPEFRCADSYKWVQAVSLKLCWVCGTPLYWPHCTFVIGPMCCVNRTSSEPPSHIDCGRWSVRNCPFLNGKQPKRRENDLPKRTSSPGEMIERNPGVTLLWSTQQYQLFDDGKGEKLFEIGEPTAVEWWSRGRKATRAEVLSSFDSGLPILEEMCRGPEDTEELRRRTEIFRTNFLPET